ncbi:hypothetical protein ANCCEY_12030 [Ancylostoma ceylanicum]|uniref:Transposable element Tc3 transposase-like DNA-binding HTH domain-containing protein n=1 Tax=Ancylostoma ceylanicum TaxID=53326 RepID=A0A0D6LA73_9BILA|nr:hypothetical protein ANCCEY_12030 [Ancylostoma ceylanicum]
MPDNGRKIGRTHFLIPTYLEIRMDTIRRRIIDAKHLAAHDERQIYRRTYNSCLSPNKIRAELKVTAPESTDWRALHRSGNVALEIVKKAPRLTFRHKTAQLEFA